MGIKKPNFKKIGGTLKGLAAKTPIGMAVNMAKGAAKCKGNPSCIANEAKKTATVALNTTKQLSQAAYKYSGAQQMVDAGKALSKCKPKDVKCIAKNLAEMASAAKGLTPSGLAATIAKNIIKEQIKKKLMAEKAKRDAKKKLASATTVQEKEAAQKELAEAEQTIIQTDEVIESNKLLVIQGDAEKNAALQQLEAAKLDPATAQQAAQVEQQAKHPDEPITTGPATPTNGEMIMGMPQQKFLMIMGAVAFFILLIVLLK